jgi:hypothetical protein
LFKQGGNLSSSNLSGLYSKLSNPQFDFDPKSGLKGWGKNLGGYWTAGNAALRGLDIVTDLGKNSETLDRAKDLASDITLSAANSPTIQYDLNADQRRLLRELQRGDYNAMGGSKDIDIMGILGDTAMGALSGAPGGWIGALIGGGLGLADSVIGDLSSGTDRNTAELEALYQAVLESEQYHNQLRKQRAYAAL